VRAVWLVFFPALLYQALAIIAALNHLVRRYRPTPNRNERFQPPVSVLKPLRGLDPNSFEAFSSQALQDYPAFELLFGVADASDPAIQDVERLQQQFQGVPIRLFVGCAPLPNGKVGVLANLAKHARHPVWVVNDSDIRVERNYLSNVVAPLRDPSVGLVTCLYRPRAYTLPALWEAVGIATDFMPSTLVAQLIGVREFGLGSTLAFRADDLDRAGGFQAIGDYLADDYQLAKRITSERRRAVLSTYTVETSLGDTNWRGCWQHQLRWARTIRFSKGGGYAGLPLTHAGIWILLAFFTGAKSLALVLLALRLLSALLGGCFVLQSPMLAGLFCLAPAWDLYSFAVWLASYTGREVRWRDRALKIDRHGRIHRADCR
jgi:ceramide glucosyltransferase